MKKNSTTLESFPQGIDNPGLEVDVVYKNGKFINDDAILDTTSVQDVPEVVSAGGVEEDEVEDRDQWASPTEFLLSCISMSVGIGNFYRFPFTAYENGGGAFLIPYIIVLLTIGKPIYFLELAIGQFSSYGQVKCWKMAPFFKGVGYGSMLGSFCVVSYYCSIMAITVFYFFSSFQKTLPWAACDESWAGAGFCDQNETQIERGIIMVSENSTERLSLAQLFFENEVIKQKEQINDGIGYPDWRLSLCLVFSWLAVFFSIVKGVKSSGKVAYFTAIYPYVILITLLIQGLTKEGSLKGIEYFITPQWKELYNPKVWSAAVSQCFFSLSTGFGPIVMYASYNPFRHNVYRDAIIVSLMDTFTSLLAGFTVFAILGSLAAELNVEISEVAKSGPGLIFVSYADAISKFDWVPQLFAVLFFLMLFSLGVGSAVSWQMAVITVICDQFSALSKFWVTAVTCCAGCVIGLIYVTPGGQFMLTLVDNFAGNFTIYVLATLEVIGIAWVYGLNNVCLDIEFMLQIKIGWFWRFTWGFFVPVALVVILIYSLAISKPLTHNDVEYPDIALVCGWLLSAVCLIVVPICAVHAIWSRKADTLSEKFRLSLKPTKDWGPHSRKNRADWELYKENLKGPNVNNNNVVKEEL